MSALDIACWRCHAATGVACVTVDRVPTEPHAIRVALSIACRTCRAEVGSQCVDAGGADWLELAESLVDCRHHERYRKWGFTNFEDYYKRELHLKPGTVDKLVGSYAFLRRSAPQVLERDGVEDKIPSFQSLDFLRRAEEEAEKGHATKETKEAAAEVRRAVIDDDMPLPQVTRLFKESLFPDNKSEDAELRKGQREAGRLARKLSELLAAQGRCGVPLAVAERVQVSLEALERALGTDVADAQKQAA